MKKPFILFITGISTSGKSMIYEALRKDNSFCQIDIHDIDEDGVPVTGRSYWRRYRVEELLYWGIKNLEKGKSTIICGITLPIEVISFEKYKPNYNIKFLLLDITQKEFAKRLTKRLIDSQEDISKEKVRVGTQKLAKRLKNQIMSFKNGYVVNTNNKTTSKVYSEVASIIESL